MATAAALEAAGWRVVRVWEHEDAAGAALAIAWMLERQIPSPSRRP